MLHKAAAVELLHHYLNRAFSSLSNQSRKKISSDDVSHGNRTCMTLSVLVRTRVTEVTISQYLSKYDIIPIDHVSTYDAS